MKYIYLNRIVFLVVFLASNISHAEECKRESSQINTLNGLRIGAPLKEYKEAYLFTEALKEGRSIPSVKRRFFNSKNKVNSVIYFESTNEAVSKIEYKFEKGMFKNSSEMAYYVSIMLNLPKKSWEVTENKMAMKCKDFTINLELGSSKRNSMLFPFLVLHKNSP